ncbi:MAG: hypothetical protein LBM66_02005 [Bifidobacteriaceae bacterium]|jgi:hypothetical protein|nr:hypothetical protein [Bifidobacteriaceae bacterium]
MYGNLGSGPFAVTIPSGEELVAAQRGGRQLAQAVGARFVRAVKLVPEVDPEGGLPELPEELGLLAFLLETRDGLSWVIGGPEAQVASVGGGDSPDEALADWLDTLTEGAGLVLAAFGFGLVGDDDDTEQLLAVLPLEEADLGVPEDADARDAWEDRMTEAVEESVAGAGPIEQVVFVVMDSSEMDEAGLEVEGFSRALVAHFAVSSDIDDPEALVREAFTMAVRKVTGAKGFEEDVIVVGPEPEEGASDPEAFGGSDIFEALLTDAPIEDLEDLDDDADDSKGDGAKN